MPRSSRASPASRPSPAPRPPCTRSGTRAPRRPCRFRNELATTRERLSVAAAEPVGPYTLLRVRRGGLDPGRPGQFFMLEAPGRLLPRPMSLCLAPPGELACLLDAVGPGTEALAALEPHDAVAVLGPLGNCFHLSVSKPLLVGCGI